MIKSQHYQYPCDGWFIEKLKEFSNDALIVEEMKESK